MTRGGGEILNFMFTPEYVDNKNRNKEDSWKTLRESYAQTRNILDKLCLKISF